jgi:hypothetical protein
MMMGLWAPTALAGIRFQDVAATAGVARTTRSYGAAWADINGDGHPDLWTGNHNYGARLYRSNGDGTFTDVSSLTELKRVDLHGAAWADFDNDGDPDLLALVGAEGGTNSIPNRFFVNDKGRLIESSVSRGLDYPLGRGRTPLWFDWNGDGALDVLIVTARRPDGQAPTALFTQQAGHFRFEVVPKLLPATDSNLFFAYLALSNRSLPGAPAVAIHQFNGFPGHIYGYGSGGLRNADKAFGFPGISGAATDVAVADFDGDLVSDFYVARSTRGSFGKLFVQTPEGVSDATFYADLDHPQGYVESVVAADFDNDMDVDLYLVRASRTSNQPNLLYENLGDGAFRAVPDAGGAQGSTVGLGSDVTTVDFDRDGFMDLFVTNGNWESEGPNQLFRNLGNRNHWLEVDLVGTVSNRDGIGARLIATVGGVQQLREQNGGMHAKSQNHARIHFGCGSRTRVDRLVVHWPSGVVQTIRDIRVDRVIRVVEPQSTALPFSDAGGPYVNIAQVSVPDSAANRRKLVDGDLAGFWVNAAGDGSQAWFEVSLAHDGDIRSVDLALRADRAYRFNVLVDGRLVGTFRQARSAAVAWQRFALPAGTRGRTVRIQCTSERWFRVHEVALQGNLH